MSLELPLLPVLLLWLLPTAEPALQVLESGLQDICRDNMAMLFYVTVINVGKRPIHVVSRMEQCCETQCEEDPQCEYMSLMGADHGTLEPNCPTNLTLIYPTMYQHNRKGACNITLLYKGRKKSNFVNSTIAFNTMVSPYEVPDNLIGYYELHEARNCRSVDQDPLDDCQPVDCHMRYDGHRNFFNTKLQLCQPVTMCLSNCDKELPDIAYLPTSNTCQRLEGDLSEDDIKYLSRGNFKCDWEEETIPSPSFIRCHHGTMNNVTGLCKCESGWESVPFDVSKMEPGITLFHMCTIQSHPLSRMGFQHLISHSYKVFLAAFICSLLFVTMGFVLYVTWWFLAVPNAEGITESGTTTIDLCPCSEETPDPCICEESSRETVGEPYRSGDESGTETASSVSRTDARPGKRTEEAK